MYRYAFEKMAVWQEGRGLVKDIYLLTKTFPTEERFGLTSQLRRAMTSVCGNIAEGSTRKSAKEQVHFSTIAYGSLIEVLSFLILSFDLNYISDQQLTDIRRRIEQL